MLNPPELIFGEVRLSRIGGSRETRHQSINASIRETRERLTEFPNVFAAHSQTPHSGIDLNVNIGNYAGVPCRTIQRLDHVQPVDNRSQLLVQASILLAFPKSSETKNWPG